MGADHRRAAKLVEKVGEGVKSAPAYTKDDFKKETQDHRMQVAAMLERVATELRNRQKNHDKSKLAEPELSGYTAMIPQISKYPRGSEEQKRVFARFKHIIDHHYRNNRHHAQFFKNGIKDMNLVDVFEMICDWCSAAYQREGARDMVKVVAGNKDWMGFSDEFEAVLENTVRDFNFGDVVKESMEGGYSVITDVTLADEGALQD